MNSRIEHVQPYRSAGINVTWEMLLPNSWTQLKSGPSAPNIKDWGDPSEREVRLSGQFRSPADIGKSICIKSEINTRQNTRWTPLDVPP